MTTFKIGRVVVGCLIAGVVVALALVLVGPVAGAQEHLITGTVLLTFAASWAVLATLSIVRTDQPQRWAAWPAGFLALAGAALIVFAPAGAALELLGWVWPPLLLALVGLVGIRAHQDLHSRTRRWVVYPLLAAYALSALGGGYQTAAEFLDSRAHQAPGELVDVGGHRLHLLCVGSGTPTVILESGLGEAAAYWGWISAAIGQGTKACAYDRAGRGWSDPAGAQQDGIAVATDLHMLLDRAHVTGPFVVVGHSSGAEYVRIFAGRYPEQVAGMVLLDGQPPEVFESLPIFPLFYNVFRRVSALLPSLARLGAGRLLYHAAFNGLPAKAGDMERFTYSSARAARSLRDEFAELPTSLAQARSFQSLGDRPLVVVTAARDAEAGWLPLQDRLATLSTNSSHRIVPYTHDGLVTDETAAQTSIGAIRDVVRAVRFNVPLDKP
jgi:pimeloyl-ACP methyl ester carboxylesterase